MLQAQTHRETYGKVSSTECFHVTLCQNGHVWFADLLGSKPQELKLHIAKILRYQPGRVISRALRACQPASNCDPRPSGPKYHSHIRVPQSHHVYRRQCDSQNDINVLRQHSTSATCHKCSLTPHCLSTSATWHKRSLTLHCLSTSATRHKRSLTLHCLSTSGTWVETEITIRTACDGISHLNHWMLVCGIDSNR